MKRLIPAAGGRAVLGHVPGIISICTVVGPAGTRSGDTGVIFAGAGIGQAEQISAGPGAGAIHVLGVGGVRAIPLPSPGIARPRGVGSLAVSRWSPKLAARAHARLLHKCTVAGVSTVPFQSPVTTRGGELLFVGLASGSAVERHESVVNGVGTIPSAFPSRARSCERRRVSQ